jgi:hypothetical protein
MAANRIGEAAMRKPQKTSSTKLAQLTKPKITSARDPRWANAERTAIDLLVEFEGPLSVLGEVPFTASPDDPEAHGRELFAQAKARQFGAVKPPSEAQLLATVEAELEQRLRDTTAIIERLEIRLDSLQDAEVLKFIASKAVNERDRLCKETKAWRTHRALLAVVPDQNGYPHHVQWPEAPNYSISTR